MPHIAIIGAGSTVFMRRIVADVLQTEALRDSTIALHDIDEPRLALSQQVAERLAEAADAAPALPIRSSGLSRLKPASAIAGSRIRFSSQGMNIPRSIW